MKKRQTNIILLINAVLVVASIPISIVTNKLFLMPIILIYAVVTTVSQFVFKEDLVYYVLTAYLTAVGPVDMLLVDVTPINVLGVGYTHYYLFGDRHLYFQYLLFSVGMYLLILLSYKIVSGFRGRLVLHTRALAFKTPISNNAPLIKYIAILLYAAVEYQLRSRFLLDVPGAIPVIRGAGIIVYLYRFFGTLLLFRCIETDLGSGEIKARNILLLLFDYFLICLPDFLFDRRGPVLYSLVVTAAYLLCVNRKNLIAFVKKNIVFVVLFVVGILGAFSIFTAAVRYKGLVTLSPLYLLSRLIGVADGFIGIDYMNSAGTGFINFSLLDYFKNVLSMNEISVNRIYTYVILGYPPSAIHTSSLPLFVGSFMYDGFWGYLMISLIFGIIFAVAKRCITTSAAYKNTDREKIYAFVGCYIIVYATARVMGGGSERIIEVFVQPVMLLLYSLFVRGYPRDRTPEDGRNS